ncbi:helix-turn-helix domain-containing protein [Actinacidiphila acididurans]|uniref:Helix-turn-helix transcriptional regulator n=1 Tax=Actinacidiphila acididurans TaxID=2784346 RepID=A0ABS2U2Q8_9ACTN|nr:helix-turn-helix transcriptional regulator [Actinacidiphila acididurans]MBM9509036.1 helix-turn-helix transcriptional regulator [Actinacidiphila acididurans]
MELNNEDDGRATPRALLGRRLRRLREQAGLSLRGLADKLGYPHTYISRVERGEQLPSEALAQAFDVYFTADGLFVELLGMARDSLIADYSREFVAKEADAIRIQVFATSVIPGLLQTEGFARESFTVGLPIESLNELDDRVATRLKRQGRLFNPEPPMYWAVIDEAALKRPTADKQVMREQLEHLLAMAEKPHVTIQVLPFEAALHPMMGGSLTLLTLKNGTTIALVESFDTGEAVDSPKRVTGLIQRFDVVRSKALPEHKSLDLIRRYLREYADDVSEHH